MSVWVTLKMMAGSLSFLIIFLGINWKMKEFMQYEVTCLLIVAIVMLKDISFLTVQKKSSSHVCWNCRISVPIAAKCTKARISLLKRLVRLLLFHKIQWIKIKHNKPRLLPISCLWLLHLQSRMLWGVNTSVKIDQATTQEFIRRLWWQLKRIRY